MAGFVIPDGTSELLVIALLPEYEGRGIGGKLWLTTDLDPTLRAYGFYRHRGWTDWNIDRGLRWMQLALDRCKPELQAAAAIQ